MLYALWHRHTEKALHFRQGGREVHFKQLRRIQSVSCGIQPLAAVSGAVSAGILRLFGIKSTNKADSVTEQEILMMVDAVNETGGIEEIRRK